VVGEQLRPHLSFLPGLSDFLGQTGAYCGTRLSKFEKKYDEGFLLGYSTTSKAYRVWNLASGLLEEVHDIEFDETNGSQDEEDNLDDVRETQLTNAMKEMDIG
jgi:hypothetical protein